MDIIEVSHDDTKVPLSRLLNPIWMLQSTGDASMSWRAPEINNGQPYLPTIQNQFLRDLIWWLRNPAGNFMGFVIGLDGTNYTAYGSDNVLATTGRDCVPPVRGWRWAILRTKWMVYPFVSYYGAVEFYFGWRPSSGGFGLKLVRGRSPS